MMTLHRLRHRAGAQGDAGQIPTVFMVMVFLGLMLVTFSIAMPFGQATDLKGGAQSAADAAALGAAEQIKDDFATELGVALGRARNRNDLRNLLDFATGGFGRAGAFEYADRNKADVTAYQFDANGGLGTNGRGQIRVTVQGRDTADLSTNGRAGATAFAKLGLRLGACTLTDDDPPPVVPTTPAPDPDPDDPDEDEDVEPPPPPDIGTVLRCGDLTLRFTIGGVNGLPTLETSLADLEDQFEPSLTG